MKRALLFPFFMGLLLLHYQADAGRLLEVKTDKTGKEAASDAKPDAEPGKSGTGQKPVTASGATVDAKDDSKTSSNSNTSNSNEDENNNGFGTYGNPSGSSTETHHYFATDHPPVKGN